MDTINNEKLFSIEIPYRMQSFRIQANITQKDMAKKLGVSKTYISNIERGKTKLPAAILLGYCNILGVSPNVMFKYPQDSGLFNENFELLPDDMKEHINGIIKAYLDK